MLADAKKIRCGPLHVGSRVKFQETEKHKVSFMDLITMPKRIWPTGPQGEAQFEGREVGMDVDRGVDMEEGEVGVHNCLTSF